MKEEGRRRGVRGSEKKRAEERGWRSETKRGTRRRRGRTKEEIDEEEGEGAEREEEEGVKVNMEEGGRRRTRGGKETD